MSVVDKYFILNKTNPCYIITWMDVDIGVSENVLRKYIHEICDKNPNLLEKLYFENNQIVSKKLRGFDLLQQYALRNLDCEEFSSCIDELLNTYVNNCGKNDFDWFFVCCVDKTRAISRIYFKINHSLCDGYMLIKILRSSNALDKLSKMNTIIEPSCKKTPLCLYDKMYYHTIGLIMLLFINLKIVLLLVIGYFKNKFVDKKIMGGSSSSSSSSSSSDNKCKKSIRSFECRSLPLHTIKLVSKLKGVTINDFMFSIMVRADYLYYNISRKLCTMIPFSLKNIGLGDDGMNNFVPITNIIRNNYTNDELLHKTHTVFDSYKYSSYIYFFNNLVSFINNYLSCDIFSLYKRSTSCIDYFFTNVIGPPIENSHINNCRFLISPVNNEFVFNIISSGNNINITCSFMDGNIDSERFEKCIYDAYRELIQ